MWKSVNCNLRQKGTGKSEKEALQGGSETAVLYGWKALALKTRSGGGKVEASKIFLDRIRNDHIKSLSHIITGIRFQSLLVILSFHACIIVASSSPADEGNTILVDADCHKTQQKEGVVRPDMKVCGKRRIFSGMDEELLFFWCQFKYVISKALRSVCCLYVQA